MTSLDPSHVPSHSGNPRHGQAVHESVSAIHPDLQAEAAQSTASSDDQDGEADDEKQAVGDSAAGPSWRGAWARRQEAKQRAKEEKEEDARKQGKIPVPPIPDLRYEQGVLMSIRPFLHRNAPPTDAATIESSDAESIHHEEKVEAGEKGALVSSALTAEGADQGLRPGEDSDIFSGPLRVEWSQVSYVLFRDQFIFPLLQGLLWGVGSLWLGSLWAWNRARVESRTAAAGLGKPSTPGLLTRLGLRTR